MRPARRVCESVHMAALGLWLGSLISTAASAAMLFPTIHRLEPSLPGYAGYTGPHWLIAGGHIVSRMFLALDVAQFASLLVAGVMLVASLLWFGLSVRRTSTFVRVALLLALVGVMSYRLGFLEPELAQTLKSYWAAAAAADNEAALRLKETYVKSHPVQSRMLVITAALVLASLVAGAWSIAKPDPPEPGEGPELEIPALARGR